MRTGYRSIPFAASPKHSTLADTPNSGLPPSVVASCAAKLTTGYPRPEIHSYPKPYSASLAHSILVDGKERLWAGSGNEGLWFREEGDWQRFRTDKFDPAQVEHLLVSERDGREEIWISTFGGGLWRLDERGLRLFSLESGDLPTNEIYNLARSRAPDGNWTIWLATRAGLVRVLGDRVDVFDRRYGLPSNAVRGVSVWTSPNGTDVLWIATENGVARAIAGANQWQTISLLGARATGVFGVLPETTPGGDERLWVAATSDGLGLYEHGRWRTFSQSSGDLPDNDVRMIKRIRDEDENTSLWVGTRGGHLLRVLDGPVFERIATPWQQHPGEAVLDLLSRRLDNRYERWIVTRQSGIYRWRDNRWTAFRPHDVVGQWRTTAITEQVDAAGRSWLWATSGQGLVRIDHDTPTLLGKGIGLQDVSLTGISLYPDAEGHQILWLGSDSHGIERVDVTDAMHPVALANNLPPPPDPTAYGAQRDSKGRVYICTNNGAQLLTPDGNGFASRVFTRRDGLLHDECNTNAQFIDAHDRFWTGTLGGLTVYDPRRELRDTQAKPLKLTGVRVDGETMGYVDSVHIASDQRNLQVDYALLSWQRETESAFRTQMIGYEKIPSAWTSQSFRDFSALAPGNYLLRIEARDYAGNRSRPIDVAVVVSPMWWQTTLARVAFTALALLMVYVLLLWRTRSLKTQQLRLAAQVAARTGELHAANARLLELSYHDSLTGLANRRRLLESLEALASTSDATRAALILADVDHFKNYNDRFGHPAGDEALRRVAKAIRDSLPARALVARHGGEEFACLLSMTDAAEARTLAEKIRSEVENCAIPVPGLAEVQRVTLSAGVASHIVASAADAHRLMRDADQALYQAKHEGRNCVRG